MASVKNELSEKHFSVTKCVIMKWRGHCGYLKMQGALKVASYSDTRMLKLISITAKSNGCHQRSFTDFYFLYKTV